MLIWKIQRWWEKNYRVNLQELKEGKLFEKAL